MHLLKAEAPTVSLTSGWHHFSQAVHGHVGKKLWKTSFRDILMHWCLASVILSSVRSTFSSHHNHCSCIVSSVVPELNMKWSLWGLHHCCKFWFEIVKMIIIIIIIIVLLYIPTLIHTVWHDKWVGRQEKPLKKGNQHCKLCCCVPLGSICAPSENCTYFVTGQTNKVWTTWAFQKDAVNLPPPASTPNSYMQVSQEHLWAL